MAKTEEKGLYSVVTFYATATAPHHKEGEEINGSQNLMDKMLANGWATADKPKEKGTKTKEV